MNVQELINELTEKAEAFGLELYEIEVLAAHQPSYPLQETVGGVWSPTDSDAIWLREFDCSDCGEHVDASDTDGTVDNAYWDEDTESYSICRECQFKAGDRNEKAQPAIWIVLTGTPYDRSPYGSRRMWDEP